MSLAPQQNSKTESEEGPISVSYSGKLDVGALLTGTPVFTEQTTSDLIFSSEAVSAGALTINEVSVPAGEAIQAHVSGGLAANSPYTIVTNCGTDETPAGSKYVTTILVVTADTA